MKYSDVLDSMTGSGVSDFPQARVCDSRSGFFYRDRAFVKCFLILAFVLASLVCRVDARAADDIAALPFWNPALSVDARAADLVSRLTLEEKIAQTYAEAPAVPRLGIPAYVYGSEALHGLVGNGKFTVFPQAIAMAATWDPDLVFQVTTAISDEAWGAINRDGTYPGPRMRSVWSPTINMARDPRWGRTPETYGEDPFLTTRIALAFVHGLQGDDPRYIKVAATPKHFVANNEDHNRDYCNAKISERSLREYYFPAFRACITEGNAQSVMGAYNAVNGVPCNANPWLLTDVLRGDWGFTGYVATDCSAPENLYTKHKFAANAVEAAAVSIKAGADVECGSKGIFPNNLMAAIKQGLVTEADIDRALTNLFRVRMRLGMFDPPDMVPFTKISPDVIGSAQHSNLARRVSEESMVLLKNEPVNGQKLLPINDSVKTITVVGPRAAVTSFGDYTGTPVNEPVTPLSGITARARGAAVRHMAWIEPPADQDFAPVPESSLHDAKREDSTADGGVARWTAKLTAASSGLHDFSVKAKGQYRLFIDGRLILEKKEARKEKSKPAFEKGRPLDTYAVKGTSRNMQTGSALLEAGKTHDVVLEFSAKGMGTDALLWAPPTPEQAAERADELEAIKKSDLVIAIMGYALEDEREAMDRLSLDLPDGQNQYVAALLAENPNTIVVLVNGSPVTINAITAQAPAILESWLSGEQGGAAMAAILFGDANPAGRLPLTFYAGMDQLPPFDDYEVSRGRTYMYLKDAPLYPFGYGLSYTAFEYANLTVDRTQAGPGETVLVRFDVSNTGGRDGDEVAQVYVRDNTPGETRPLKRLRGFKRIHIPAGKTQAVEIPIAIKDLAYWNSQEKKFNIVPGEYEILVGPSSDKVLLNALITVKNN